MEKVSRRQEVRNEDNRLGWWASWKLGRSKNLRRMPQ